MVLSLVGDVVSILLLRSPSRFVHEEQKEEYRSHTYHNSVLDSIVGVKPTYWMVADFIRSELLPSFASSSSSDFCLLSGIDQKLLRPRAYICMHVLRVQHTSEGGFYLVSM